MDYCGFEAALSKPRLNRYKTACNGNELKAFELYKLNINLSKDFYGILALFEVVLRNAINNHYKKHFSDDDWIINQTKTDFFPEEKKNIIIKEHNKIIKTKLYTPDKLVAALTFGLWVDMFSRNCFAKGNKTLLKIFPDKEKGVKYNQSFIHEELDDIRKFRNKIAHYEAICFNKENNIYVPYLEHILQKISKYIHFLGLPNDFLDSVDSPMFNIEKLKSFCVEEGISFEFKR